MHVLYISEECVNVYMYNHICNLREVQAAVETLELEGEAATVTSEAEGCAIRGVRL